MASGLFEREVSLFKGVTVQTGESVMRAPLNSGPVSLPFLKMQPRFRVADVLCHKNRYPSPVTGNIRRVNK